MLGGEIFHSSQFIVVPPRTTLVPVNNIPTLLPTIIPSISAFKITSKPKQNQRDILLILVVGGIAILLLLIILIIMTVAFIKYKRKMNTTTIINPGISDEANTTIGNNYEINAIKQVSYYVDQPKLSYNSNVSAQTNDYGEGIQRI